MTRRINHYLPAIALVASSCGNVQSTSSFKGYGNLVGMVFIALVLAFMYYSIRLARRRTEQLKLLARQMGFKFEETRDIFGQGILALPTMKKGRRFFDILHGNHGSGEVIVLDVMFMDGTPGHRSQYRQTAALYRFPVKQFPGFELSTEHIFAKMGAALGFQDIDFENHDAFSEKFLLRGEDESAIRALFTVDRRAALEKYNDWSIEAVGEWIFLSRWHRQETPETMRQFLEKTKEIARIFI